VTLGGLAIGAELGDYRLEALVGRGGMSAVYRARDLRLGRRVALKFLAPNLADDERFRERFLAESRLAASLDHAGIVPIFEAGEADGRLYMAMRYVEGTDLHALLDRDAPLAPERAVELVSQLAGALDAAHARGLVHRDVKPAPVASANVADAPVHQAKHHSQTAQRVPPRVDGIGSQPSVSRPASTTVVPLVQPSSDGGFDWASAAIGAAALVSIALLGAAGWMTIRGRRTTMLRRSRPAS
jgi:protein kinase-like protein